MLEDVVSLYTFPENLDKVVVHKHGAFCEMVNVIDDITASERV